MTYPTLAEYTLAADIETKELLDLAKYGPGSHRHYLEGEDSYILGAAISDSKNDYYFPACPELFQWMREIQDDHEWIFHNYSYDASWLYYEGFQPKKVMDTMGLVRLLDEDRQPKRGFPKPYSLDACAHDYLGFRKNEAEIKKWCEDNGLRGNPQKWLWKMPVEMVARYAKIDTRLTYGLWDKLIPQIEEQELSYIWQIEKELLPILARTHHEGLLIDNEARLKASEGLGEETAELYQWMKDKAGCDFNTNSGKQLAPIFDKLGIKYKLTEKGNPSFKGEDLLPYGVDPDMEYFPHVLVTHNKLQKLKRDFLDRLEDFMVDGRVHPVINPYGTKTGRPTAKTPNIFQIPKRGRGKKLCRSLFIPEPGEQWVSCDVASEEYRVFAHYAMGKGSDNYREKYNTIPGYDMHVENAELAGCDRSKAKTIGLGVLFGMGAKKMALNLGQGEAEGLRLVKRFHTANPSFSYTAKAVQRVAERRGYIHTIAGRRRRFPGGEGAYKGLNFLTQGCSADWIKIMVVELYKKGLLEYIHFILYLYDEINFSVSENNLYLLKEFYDMVNTIMPLKVKFEVGFEIGRSWGALEKHNWKEVLEDERNMEKCKEL